MSSPRTVSRPAAQFMLRVVARALESGTEDLVFLHNDEQLLLARVGGALAKSGRSGFWDIYPFADQLVPG